MNSILFLIAVSIFASCTDAFNNVKFSSRSSSTTTNTFSTSNHHNHHHHVSLYSKRRNFILSAGGGLFGGMFSSSFGNNDSDNRRANASEIKRGQYKSVGSTNEVVKVVNGIKHKRLGGSDIIVSELGLGTQRWVSDDFNAPSQQDCYKFMDEAILKSGINLIDTAEQYPIPSGKTSREGDTETVIGNWIKDRKVSRDKVVIATKITGGRYVEFKNNNYNYLKCRRSDIINTILYFLFLFYLLWQT